MRRRGVNFEPYDIVVIPFPFTEKKAVKHRPAVVVSTTLFNERHNHLTLAMITSAKNSSWDSDVTIQEWKTAALMVPCKIRFKLFTLPKELILRRLGRLSSNDREVLNNTAGKYLIAGK